MAKINYRAVLSLTEPNHQIFLRFRQDDTQTQTLSVEITANGKLFPFTGYTVEFVNITRSDSGQPIIERVDSISPESARIEFTLDARSLQWLGKNVAYFSFKDSAGNEVYSTHNFEYEVVRGVHKEPILDSGYLWQCDEVIGKTEKLVDQVDGILQGDIATSLANEIAKHTEDRNNPHRVTKGQIGLGNVPNYPAATPEEVTTGASNASLMTPANTKEMLTKRAVLQTENQEIYGVKNFKDEPQYNGKSLVLTSSSLYIDSGFKNYTTGWVRMQRYGDLIIVSFSLSPRNNAGTWMTIIPIENILDEYKFASETYSAGAVGSSEVGDATCLIGMNENGLEFGAWNRPSGTAPFAGQIIGIALNK